jgi:hypothetical protein
LQIKLKQLENEHSQAISDMSEEKKQMMDQLQKTNREEIDRLLEQTKDSQRKAVKSALEDAKLQHERDLQTKHSQYISEIEKLKEELQETNQVEVTRKVAEAIKIESLKIDNANIIIAQLRKERESLLLHHEAEIGQLKNNLDYQLREKEKQIQDMNVQIQQVDTEKVSLDHVIIVLKSCISTSNSHFLTP